MSRYIEIVTKKDDTKAAEAFPYTIQVFRDDQTITWKLSDGYSWPNPNGPQPAPIVFLEADEDRKYHAWPGTVPQAVGARPPSGTPDRRLYTVNVNRILERGVPSETYHYAFRICPIDHPDCTTSVSSTAREAPRTQQRKVGSKWHDPDVENQSKP
jgi:hypothetical protein